MSWRTVSVTGVGKLDYKMDYLVVRKREGTKRIHLGEIGLLFIESTSISLTTTLITKLVEHKIKVIFCDNKCNPESELVPYYGSHDCSAKVKEQIEWTKASKEIVWTAIVSDKIRKQMEYLTALGYKDQAGLLSTYIEQIELNDCTNREGHAAKVYFNTLFGREFSRGQDNQINSALNYGYSILLSAFNREISASGYLTQLGIFHDNMFNSFNFGSDLMEPYRPLVDRKVKCMGEEGLTREMKMCLIDILNIEVVIDNKRQTVSNAISIYCRSVFKALNCQDPSMIEFYESAI